MKTFYSVYLRYSDGVRIELRQFPNRARAIGYAAECAKHEHYGTATTRKVYEVAKIEVVTTFGESGRRKLVEA